MVLTPDSIIQQASGTFTGTTGTATLPNPSTAGNTVIMVMAGTAGGLGATGFTSIRNNSIIPVTANLLWKNTAGGETSFSLTNAGANLTAWICYEIEGLDQSNPVDVIATNYATGSGGTLTTPANIPLANTFDGMVLVTHAGEDTTSTVAPTWSGHTGGVSELTEVTGDNGTISIGLTTAVAFTYTGAPQVWSSTATKTNGSGQQASSTIVVFTAANAKYAADVAVCTGFEFGTAAGITLGGAGTSTNVFDSLAGTPTVVSTNPRSGTYCLELSSSAAAESLSWSRTGVLNVLLSTQITIRLSVYFPTSLPGADLELLALTPATAGDAAVLRYESSDSTLRLKVGTGTEVVSDAAVSANTWISIDLRVDGRTTTHRADWRIDYTNDAFYVGQAQATATGTVVTNGWDVRLGWASASTATVRYDDVVVGRFGGHYPLGNMIHEAITVDPSGTLTVSGSTANFNVMTANGTLAAWNATNARNAIDERPPTIGASADGIVQVATAISDYVEIPTTTISAVNLGAAIRAVRLVACGWAASTTTATIGFRSYDGVSEITMFSASDYQFDNSTTTPAWHAQMVRSSGSRQDWTQSKLDALVFRMGFSGDASPAVGIHNIIGEVCLRVGDLVEVISIDEGQFTVDWRMDPDSWGVIQALITTPPDRGAVYEYSLSGVPQTPVSVPAGTASHPVYIGATDVSVLTEQTLTPA
jgi:hypothetical protein